MTFNERETATVLHALRRLQMGSTPEEDACDHFEDREPLSDEEIDALCERINFDDDSSLSAPRAATIDTRHSI